jgi:hypothetical protein
MLAATNVAAWHQLTRGHLREALKEALVSVGGLSGRCCILGVFCFPELASSLLPVVCHAVAVAVTAELAGYRTRRSGELHASGHWRHVVPLSQSLLQPVASQGCSCDSATIGGYVCASHTTRATQKC